MQRSQRGCTFMGIRSSIHKGATVEYSAMETRAFPNAVCGKTGRGLTTWTGVKQARTKARKRQTKAFPFHPAERSARELKGILARYS